MRARDFTMLSNGPDRSWLMMRAEHSANQLWIPTHLTPDQAREFVLDQFKRAVVADRDMLEVRST
jgi:hypothetical protein